MILSLQHFLFAINTAVAMFGLNKRNLTKQHFLCNSDYIIIIMVIFKCNFS